MSDEQAITMWAKVKSELKEASGKVLESNGLNWDSFNELETTAILQMSDEVVNTEYGWVQLIPDSPVQWKAWKMEPGEEVFTKKRLKLLQKQPTKQGESYGKHQ